MGNEKLKVMALYKAKRSEVEKVTDKSETGFYSSSEINTSTHFMRHNVG